MLRYKLVTLIAFAAFPLIGCNDSTAPESTMNLRTEVTVTRVEVIKDGDATGKA